MKLLEGGKISDKILKNIQKKIKSENLNPGLAVVLIGENEASKIYVNLKKKAAEKIGIKFYLSKFSENSPESEVIEKIENLNKNKKISGIIVQLPLPKGFNTQKIINAVNPQKDVDGFHPENKKLQPVFPGAILEMIKSTGIDLKSKKAIAISNSKKFGEVMKKVLEKNKIQADYILSKDIKKDVSAKYDILISAVGKPNFIKGEMLKKDAIVIDGGITKKDRKILGDVDFKSVEKYASFLSPVPGGVGPVTIACLLKNVYLASRKSR